VHNSQFSLRVLLCCRHRHSQQSQNLLQLLTWVYVCIFLPLLFAIKLPKLVEVEYVFILLRRLPQTIAVTVCRVVVRVTFIRIVASTTAHETSGSMLLLMWLGLWKSAIAMLVLGSILLLMLASRFLLLSVMLPSLQISKIGSHNKRLLVIVR
jgi:hypothetical protein